MKKINLVLILLVLATFLTAGQAIAYPVQVDDVIGFNDGKYGTTGGGEFDIVDASNNVLFKTFCLEISEHVDYSSNFRVTNISGAAYGGGLGDKVSGGDPISQETQWLYWNYVTGALESLTGYTYSNAGINALQRAIWVLEQELNSTSDTLAIDLITAANSAVASGADLGDVAVMNIIYDTDVYNNKGTLTHHKGESAQSQLVAAPVPEPATLILLGSGLAGLAFYRRKMKK